MTLSIQFVAPYWPGVAGLLLGVVCGMLIAATTRARSVLSEWDARVTVPLVLAAAGAHLLLIPAVELERQVLFALYGVALLVVTAFAIAGVGIWRLGAIVFPLGSIGAYFYFAFQVHHADYIGLLVKLVEFIAVAAATASALSRRHRAGARPSAG